MGLVELSAAAAGFIIAGNVGCTWPSLLSLCVVSSLALRWQILLILLRHKDLVLTHCNLSHTCLKLFTRTSERLKSYALVLVKG